MSFLSTVKNFIKTEILGVEEVKPKTKAVHKEVPAAIIESEVDAPVDIVKLSKEPNISQEKQGSLMSRKAMEQSIENIPSQSFDMKKLLKKGLIEKITGISEEDFYNMTPQQQQTVIRTIKYSIDKFENMVHNGTLSKDASPEELIMEFSTILYQAVSSGDFDNIEEFEEEVGEVIANIEPDIDKKSHKEQMDAFKDIRVSEERKLDAELKSIEKLPEAERDAATLRLRRRHRHKMKGSFFAMSANYDSPAAVNALTLLSADEMAHGMKFVLRSRANDEKRTEAADYADYNVTKDILSAYAELGDEVPPQVFEEYNATNMTYKSNEAAIQYQSDYKSDRYKYEAAFQKQQNGEPLTEEEKQLLAVMSHELYTAMAKGIGSGALENINMTNEEKASFLNTWMNDAKELAQNGYDDFDEVVSDVNNKLETNADYKEINEKIVKLKQEASNNASKQDEVSHSKKITEEIPSYQTVTNPIAQDKIKQKQEMSVVATEQKKSLSKNVSKESIVQCIREEGVDNAVDKYKEDAIKIILEDPNYKHLLPKVAMIIKSYDLNALINITSSCSDSAYLFVIETIDNDDYTEILNRNREHTRGLCHAASVQLEQIKGDNK